MNLRRRLRQYINGNDKRRLIPHLLPQTRNIDTIECAHGFEAEVREATLIAKFRPPFNRRSKEPRQYWWISGARPRSHDVSRATISRDPRSPNALGPFRTRQKATTAARSSPRIRKTSRIVRKRSSTRTSANRKRCSKSCRRVTASSIRTTISNNPGIPRSGSAEQ